MMKKTAKAKVAIVLAALALATACSDSKDDNNGNAGGGGGGTDVCTITPEACPVGQQNSQGYFIKSTRNGASLSDVLLIDLKAGFYGTNPDAMYKNISGTDAFYNGEVVVSGSATISFEDQRHQYSDDEDLNFNGFGRTSSVVAAGNRCRIATGEYVITTLEKGEWSQRSSNSSNFAEIDSVRLELKSGDNVIEATLDGTSINIRAEAQGGYLVLDGGRLTVQRYNGTRCSGINANF